MSLLPFFEYYARPLPGYARLGVLLERLARRSWQRTLRPPAPRSVKAEQIRKFATAGRRVLIETGTFYGDMIDLLRDDFDQLVSIELSTRLARRARRRFAEDARIEILEGDSGSLLGEVLQRVARPVVLWLDGHYSGPLTARGEGDTPLLREIQQVLLHGTEEDVVLVDDARLLDSDIAYPKLAELRAMVEEGRPTWGIAVAMDILHAGPGIGAAEDGS